MVNDHKFWAGGRSKASVFPDGAKCMSFDSCSGAGSLENYQDDNAKIRMAQDMAVKKAKNHPMKEGYRY